MSTPEPNTVAYAEAAWDVAVAQNGPVGLDARRAYLPTIARFAALGMTPAQAGHAIAVAQAAERAAFGAGFGAFQALVAQVELCGAVLEGPVEPRRVLDGLLSARLAMAEIYHHLALIAGRADVPDVTTPEATAAMVAESRAELEQLRASNPAA